MFLLKFLAVVSICGVFFCVDVCLNVDFII